MELNIKGKDNQIWLMKKGKSLEKLYTAERLIRLHIQKF